MIKDIGKALIRHWEWTLAVLLVPIAWVLSGHYGMAWDDAQHAVYGSYALDYFLSGFKDMRWRHDIGGLYLYGTIFDLPSAALHRMFGDDVLRFRPFLISLTGILAIPAVAKIGRYVGGERAAVFGALSLLLMPQFVGHSFVNCKDIPLATAIAWAVLSMLGMFRTPTLKSFALCGTLCGVALSVRIGGVMVYIFMTATVAFLAFRFFLEERPLKELQAVFTRKMAAGALLMLGISFGMMVALWPYAHQNPFLNPLDAFRQSTAFPLTYPVQFAGQEWDSAKLPWYYLATMLALTMPLAVLAPCLLGILIEVVNFFRKWRTRDAVGLFLILFWVFFPIAYVILKKPNIYDGIRHFLFLLPALAVCSGLGLNFILARVGRLSRTAVPLLAGIWFVAALPALILWHPYQQAFFNVLAGERKSLHERFETDYWMTSYKEAAGILAEVQSRAGSPLNVGVGGNGLSSACFGYFAPPGMKLGFALGPSGNQPFPKDADFYVAIPRYGMWKNYPEAPVFREIRRDGVLLCLIRQNPSAGGKQAPAPLNEPATSGPGAQ
jgi:4-amino-4-deoxy-L-arabinose transferase-like glycosyltransferase